MRYRLSHVVMVVVCLLGLSIASVAMAAPSISSLSPTSGAIGASVTITGTGFGATQGSSTVKFNTTIATVTSWSASSIVATVPSSLTTGSYTVTVTVSSVASNGKSFTVVATPAITSLSPTSGPVGQQVTINGTGFGATRGSSTVAVNGTLTGTPSSWSATQIKVNVPVGVAVGAGNVVVHASGVDSNGSPFTVLATPTITSLSAASGMIGDTITITGTSFGATQGSSTIKFNGTAASPSTWSDTSIVTPIPTGATSGTIVVAVNGVNSAGTSFIVFVTPTISSLSPSSSAVGGSVTINGSGFQANQGLGSSTVTFNGVAATPTSWNNTQIKVPVPGSLAPGSVTVVVTVGGLSSDPRSFTVKPTPTITSASPMFGAVGVLVTIKGANFGNTQGSSTVKFNGTTATPTSWSAMQIVLPVPTGATTGNLVLRTSNVDVNAGLFTVTTITSLDIFPKNLTLPRRSVERFRAMATNSDGSTQDIASSATWQATDTSIASIDSPAVVRGLPGAHGQTGVQATFGSFTASTTLTFSGGSFTTAGTSLLKPRGSHTSTLLQDGRVLIAGGGGTVVANQPPRALASAEIFDPAARSIAWTGNLTIAREQHTATRLQNGKVLLVGGLVPRPNDASEVMLTATADLYDPSTGLFTATGSMHNARNGHNAILLPNGQVLIVGGNNEFGGFVFTAELYDPATGTFSETGSLATARIGGVSALLGDGTVLVVSGGGSATSERYDPATGLFTLDATLTSPIWWSAAATLADGKVVIAGGQDTGVALLTSSRIYDPAPKIFVNTSDLAIPRGNQTATLLDDGSVLMVGGELGGAGPYGTAERFDPATNSYIGAGALTLGRSGMTATKLADGTVAIIGGDTYDGLIELYGNSLPTPTSLTITPPSATLITGGTMQFGAADDLGRPRLDATWSVSDPSKATLRITPTGASLTGVDLGEVTLTADIDGVQAHAHVTIAPQTLRITPATVTMLIGQTRQFNVVDEYGRPSSLATWTISDDTLATLGDGSSPTLTALAAGQVTLTATVLGVQMQTQVTISPDATYATGAVIWGVPAVVGFTPVGIVQAVEPQADTPATYSVQNSDDNTHSLVLAFTSDGRVLWQRSLRKLLGRAVADGTGGLLVTESCDSENDVMLSDLDPTGGSRWAFPIAPQNIGTGCPTDGPRLAIRHDGAVAVTAPLNTFPSFAVIANGGYVSQPYIPPSNVVDMFGHNIALPATMSAPIVDAASNIYVMYADRQIPYPPTTVASQLYLLKIAPSGAQTTLQLGSSTDSLLLPGSLMPDGTGGIIATWAIDSSNPPGVPEPYQAAHIVSDIIVSTYAMPNAPTTITGLPIVPKLVLGENGTAFASYDTNVTSFNLDSGAVNWNYVAGQRIDFVGYTNGGGLTLVDAASNQVAVDASGNLLWSVSLAAASLLQPTWTGAWQGAVLGSGIGVASINAIGLDWGTSFWSTEDGNPSQTGTSVETPAFPYLPQDERVAIYNALHDLVNRLKNQTFAALAQTKVFTPMLTDRDGVTHTTAQFVEYLTKQEPRFHNGLASTYCYNSMSGWPRRPCFPNWPDAWVNGLTIRDYLARPDQVTTGAITSTPENPLLVFFRPALIGLSALPNQAAGLNLGNEGLLFHEALHGFYGRQDWEIVGRLGLGNSVSCKINYYLQHEVLSVPNSELQPLDTEIKMECARTP